MTTIARALNALDTEVDRVRNENANLRRRVDSQARLVDELAQHRDACQCNELDAEVRRLRCRLEELGELA